MKHTKGPWTAIIKKQTEFSNFRELDTIQIVTGAGSHAIDCNLSGKDFKESAANAQLIAAAPEMLEELSQLLDALENKILKTDSKTLTEEMIYSIKTKLNKAKGQE